MTAKEILDKIALDYAYTVLNASTAKHYAEKHLLNGIDCSQIAADYYHYIFNHVKNFINTLTEDDIYRYMIDFKDYESLRRYLSCSGAFNADKTLNYDYFVKDSLLLDPHKVFNPSTADTILAKRTA